MSDPDNGIFVEEDWKTKYEALLGEYVKLEEEVKLFVKLEEELEDRVRCPVCLELPTSSPVFSCPNGHLVCASCYPGSQSNCFLCRTKMHTPRQTVSLVAITVVENIRHRCRFEADGCKVKD